MKQKLIDIEDILCRTQESIELERKVQETRENRDPIERIRALLLVKKYLTEEKIKELDKIIRNEVAEAAELAREKEMPKASELLIMFIRKSINDICKREYKRRNSRRNEKRP